MSSDAGTTTTGTRLTEVSTSVGVESFEAERPRLLALAYRLTGSVADAEDAVQEAWLRLARTDDVRDLPAWLTRVVSRLCLDRLGSAARRRESYVGQWLPEPVVRPYVASTDDRSTWSCEPRTRAGEPWSSSTG